MNSFVNFSIGSTTVVWLVFAVAASTSTARYIIQRRKYGRLLAEDYVHIGALAALVPFIAVGTAWSFLDAFHPYVPWAEISDTLRRLQTAWWIFFCLSLYLSKAAFLALYRRLFGVSRAFAVFWWLAVVFTACTGLAVLISQFFICGGKVSQYWDQKVCGGKVSLPEIYNQSALVLACNVSSDVILILLPLGMLSKLQITRSRRRWRLIPIFLVGVITIAIDVLTWAFQLADYQHVSWVSTFCLFVEPSIAVIVASLPTLVFARKADDDDSEPYQGAQFVESPLTRSRATSVSKTHWLASVSRGQHNTADVAPSEV